MDRWSRCVEAVGARFPQGTAAYWAALAKSCDDALAAEGDPFGVTAAEMHREAACGTEPMLGGPAVLRTFGDCIAATGDRKTAAALRAKAAQIEAELARMEGRARKPDAQVGMTADQVRNETRWGGPNHINRTTTAAGVREQWVYGDNYLYFENGVLVEIQQQGQ
jgi:hypothetical protein